MNATKDAAGNPRALELEDKTRGFLILSAVLSLAGAALVLWVYRDTPSTPDLFLGVLAIGALIFLGVALIGRLPVGFELGGMQVEFRRAELADLIGTVRSTLKDDEEARDALLTQLRDAVGPRAYKEAAARFRTPEDEDEKQESAVADGQGSPLPLPEGDAVDTDSSATVVQRLVHGLATDPEGIQEKFDVPSSGQGKTPRFDYYFSRRGVNAVLEVEQYWNPTTVDLISRKTDRALLKGTPVDKVIVVAPRQGVSAFREKLGNRPNVLIIALEALEDKNTTTMVDDFLSNK